MKNGVLSLGVTLILLAAGCGKENAVDVKKTGMDAVPETGVIVRVNGFDLTKKMWEDYADMHVAFYKLMKEGKSQPSFGKGNPAEQLEAEARRVRISSAQACLPYFIQNTILHQASKAWVDKHGPYPESNRQEIVSWLQKKYVSNNPKRIKSFEALRAKLKAKGHLEAFDAQVAVEIENELYLTVACSNKYVMDEFVVSNVVARHFFNNLAAAQTNRAIFATATNVLAKIRAGDDFATLADQYSMDEQKTSGGYIGFSNAADFPGEEVVWNAVKDLKDGETTGVIDADDSWQIYQVMSHRVGENTEDELELSRIYFRRAWIIPELSRDDIVKALKEDRRNRLIEELMAEKLPQTKLEFPSGRNIFPSLDFMRGMLDKIGGSTNATVETAADLPEPLHKETK